MDLLVSCRLTNGDLTLETLWNKFEEFCKPQSNGVRATAEHIKQANSNAQPAQINLLCHQYTELAHKKKKGHKCKYTSNPKKANYYTRKVLIHQRLTTIRNAILNVVVILGIHKAFPVQQSNIFVRHIRNTDTLQAYAFPSRRNLHITAEEIDNDSDPK